MRASLEPAIHAVLGLTPIEVAGLRSASNTASNSPALGGAGAGGDAAAGGVAGLLGVASPLTAIWGRATALVSGPSSTLIPGTSTNSSTHT